jgi:flagellum-specific peptidoglycan hydrolase FlgJ
VNADQVQGTTVNSIVEQYGQRARSVANEAGLYASVMVAQALLESGWGTSGLAQAPYNNLFGIKGSFNGQSVTLPTMEYINKKWVKVNAKFRKYPSIRESFQDNANLLTVSMGHFYYGAWKANAKTYHEATKWLQGRYATDPTYASKLDKIINDFQLTRFDSAGAPGTQEVRIHTVQATDYLALLAQKYNTTIPNIKKWNNIKGDTIYIGQRLIVSEPVKSAPVKQEAIIETKTVVETKVVNQYYTVQSGDSLWVIGQKHSVGVNEIKENNKLKSDLIYVGQKLLVKKAVKKTTKKVEVRKVEKAKPVTKTVQKKVEVKTQPAKDVLYTVKVGDSVWGIANSNKISMNDLVRWNKLKDNFIYPGQKLIVKKASTPKVATPKPATPKSSTSSKTATKKVASKKTTSSENDRKITVKSGDTLWGISQVYGTTVQQLKEKNGLSSTVIYVGQSLSV